MKRDILGELSPEAQVIAQLIALMGMPSVTASALLKGLRWLNLKWQHKRYVQSADLYGWLEELEAAGFHDRRHKPELNSEVREEILEMVVAGNRNNSWHGRPCSPLVPAVHDGVCEYIKKLKAGREEKYYWKASRADYDMFLLRARMIFLTEGAGERFNLALKDAEAESLLGNWRLCAEKLLHSVKSGATAQLPSTLTAKPVLEKVRQAVNSLSPLKDHIAAIEIELGKRPDEDVARHLRRVKAQAHLLRGEFDDAVETDSSAQTSACVKLLNGQYKAALKDFQATFASGDLEPPETDLLNLLTIAAFALSDVQKDRKTASQLATQLGATSFGSDVQSSLHALAKSQMGTPTEDDISELELSFPLSSAASELHFLFLVLCRKWGRLDLPEYVRTRAEEAESNARRNGNTWYADELAGVLGVKGKGRLTTIVEFAPEWMDRLAALRRITVPEPPPEPKKPKKAANSRLVWVVEEGSGLEIHPYEQMLRKNGTFTKGRKVALKRLYGKPDFKGEISPEDERLLSLIQCDVSWGRYGSDETYYIKRPWDALIGHPLVFHSECRDAPIPVIRGTLSLSVTSEPGGHRIAVHSQGKKCDGFLLHLDPAKLTVTPLSEEQEACLKLLQKPLFVPEEGRDELRSTLDNLAAVIPIQSELQQTHKSSAADAGIVFQLKPLDNLRNAPELTAKAVVYPLGPDGPHCAVAFGAEQMLGNRDGVSVCVTRDLELEQQNLDAVLAKCPTLMSREAAPGLYFLSSPEWALDGLAELKAADVPLEWPEGEPLNLRQLSKDAFRISVKEVQDWFEFSGKLRIDADYVVAFQDLLDKDRIFGRFIRLDDGSFIQLTEHYHRLVDSLAGLADRSDKTARVHKLAAAALPDELPCIRGVRGLTDLQKRVCKAMSESVEVPASLDAELRNYQEDGFRWMARLSAWGAGACLADDMGLGKTVQALAVLLMRQPEGPALVVAPTSVCTNWQVEAMRFAPTLNIVDYRNAGGKACLKELRVSNVVVVSYGMLLSHAAAFGKVRFGAIVLDEAQAIKNPDSKRAKAICKLHAEFRLALTGTPVENHPLELWSIFQFINPGLLGSRKRFETRFAGPIQDGDRAASADLKRLVSPFILRRRKSDILQELPPKTELVHHVELSTEEASFYEAVRRNALEQLEESAQPNPMAMLAQLMRLRRACCHPALVDPSFKASGTKLEAFLELADELRENRHRALVFSQFVDHLSIIRKSLDARDVGYCYLDGSTPAAERDRQVRRFQNGDAEFFLLSLKAGGVGLNLTAADYVIHLDPWWNPAVEDQASDRAHRIGQTRPVTVYRLIAKGTVEEKIMALHERKRNLAETLLEGTDTAAGISAEEILELFRTAELTQR